MKGYNTSFINQLNYNNVASEQQNETQQIIAEDEGQFNDEQLKMEALENFTTGITQERTTIQGVTQDSSERTIATSLFSLLYKENTEGTFSSQTSTWEPPTPGRETGDNNK